MMEKAGVDAQSFNVIRDVSSSVIYIVFIADKLM